MLTRNRARLSILTVFSALMTMGLLALGPSVSAGSTGPPIGPNQSFVGLINGKPFQSTITMVCSALPTTVVGHPATGQTLAVESVGPVATAATPFGNTGGAGRSIVARFVTPVASSTAVGGSVVFTAYGSVALPTTLVLPCQGKVPVSFVAMPTSATARSSTVTVTLQRELVPGPTPVARLGRSA